MNAKTEARALRRVTKRAKLRLAVKVAAQEAREAKQELDGAASRFSSAREHARRANAHLLIRVKDAEDGGAL